MLAQIKSISLVLSFLISQRTLVNAIGKYSDLNTQDAWLYPGVSQKGVHLTYSQTTDWSDLWKMLSKNGFYTVGLICVKGVFILYQEPLYEVLKPDGFEILTGTLKCRTISENTKSIQLAGSVGRMLGPSITFFQKPYFGSVAFPTVNNVGSDFFQKMEYTRSAIIAGKTPWTLKLSTGETICVKPEFDESEETPVCLIRDFETLLDIETEDDDTDTRTNAEKEISKNNTVIIKASMGCEKVTDEQSIHRIQDCLYWGLTNKPESLSGLKIEDDEVEGRSAVGSLTDLCSNDESTKRIFKLYKAAITQTFDSNLLVGLNLVGKHSWKLDLLDWIFTIVIDVVPDDIVPTSFLNKVRELFVHKLVSAWNKDESTEEFNLLERNYKFLLLLTEKCNAAIMSSSNSDGSSVASQLSEQFSGMWNNIQSMDDFKNLIIPEFVRVADLDIITEMFWIIGHMALHICHAEHMTTSHFWALYLNVFWRFYVLPIVPEWRTHTQGLNLIFGGIDHKEEYNKLAMFAGVTWKRARNMELLQRPKAVSQ